MSRRRKYGPELRARIRELWIADELSLAGIGERVGLTKNAVSNIVSQEGLRLSSPQDKSKPVHRAGNPCRGVGALNGALAVERARQNAARAIAAEAARAQTRAVTLTWFGGTPMRQHVR